jgi:hypothetical protein
MGRWKWPVSDYGRTAMSASPDDAPSTGDAVTLEQLFKEMQTLLWKKEAISEVAEILLKKFDIRHR